MKKNRLVFLFVVVVALAMTVSSCNGSAGVQPTFTPTEVVPTSTPDPCASENLPVTIGQFNRLMREFDDTSLLAQNTPTQNLAPLIEDLQRVRRDTEDYEVPVCLTNLKSYALSHMNIVIDVLIVSGSKDLRLASPTLVSQISQNIAAARQYHDQYTLEMARLLGITIVPATPEATETPKP